MFNSFVSKIVILSKAFQVLHIEIIVNPWAEKKIAAGSQGIISRVFQMTIRHL